MRSPKYRASLFQLFMYDFVFNNKHFVLDIQIFPMHCLRRFLSYCKLTFVEVHDKKESKLFSLASCTN